MIPTANAGVNYYRMATFAWQMRKYKDVEVALFAFQYGMVEPHPWQRDLAEMPIVRQQIASLCDVADLVIWQPVHYRHSLDFFVEMRSRFEKPMLVESDDNYVDVPTWNESHESFKPRSSIRATAIEHMRLSDGLVLSTPYLSEAYSKFHSQHLVVPNALDFKVWDPVSPPKRHSRVRIGWIGGRTHIRELLMVAPVIKEVIAENPDVWFYVINSGLKHYAKAEKVPYVFEDTERVFYTDRNVSINLYPRFMSSFGFDIGIAPLEDCHFNRAKSNLRWLEYSALRVPTVATDISHFSQTVRNGQDGFLVKNNDLGEWKRRLTDLVRDTRLRQQIGEAAYRRVKSDFNVRKTAGRYLSRLKDIAGIGGNDEQNGLVPGDWGFSERSESRQVLHVANR